MKKFIALAMAVLMLSALAVPCFAQGGETIIDYTVEETYTFVVPERISLVKDGAAEGTIAVDTCALIPGNTLVITAVSASDWALNDEAATKFQFDKTVFEFTAVGEDTFAVSFVNGAPTVPSKTPYQAVITYTSEIVEPVAAE